MIKTQIINKLKSIISENTSKPEIITQNNKKHKKFLTSIGASTAIRIESDCFLRNMVNNKIIKDFKINANNISVVENNANSFLINIKKDKLNNIINFD